MENNLYIVSSFVSNGIGGNKAGVVFMENLTSNQKQSIASKQGLSEIAFLSKSTTADFKVEFYTPNSEIDFCGHATIALFGLMHELKMVEEGVYSLETMNEIIKVYVQDNSILMEQVLPTFGTSVPTSEIASSLNILDSDILDSEVCQSVSTGLLDIIVPIKDLETLKNISPNFEAIHKVSDKYDVVGYHLFAVEDGQYYTRNFAPRYAINEESATGSSSGALAAYLVKRKILPLNSKITFKQGYFMNSPSDINVEVIGQDNIEKVLVGGRVLTDKEIINFTL